MSQPEDVTTGEPQGEVATTVRLPRPWYTTLLTTALLAAVPLAIGGVASMQYLDALEPQPTTLVPDNSSRYEGPVDDSVQHVAVRRTVEIDPATGGVTVPNREDRVRELSGTGDLDMPAAALKAYRNAAATLATTDPSCNIDWALMAGIGRVESDHGRYGGATVSTNGKTYPHILGLPLDGSPGVAAIPDTDGGALDSDTTWDRAVGPMQFIPSTWGMVAADGDGDGERDPHDLDDAALAAGVYLCAGSADVSTRAGAEAAVFSYNHSDEYVAMVLAIAEAYRSGEVYLPSVPYGSGGGSAPTLDRAPGNNGESTGKRADRSKSRSKAGRTTTTGPNRAANGMQATQSTPKARTKRPGPTATSDEPADEESESTVKPAPEAQPEPTREEPEPEPEFVAVDGTLTACAPTTWCVGGKPLNWGGAGYIETHQAGDYNGDGQTTAILLELQGLEGTHVLTSVKNDATDSIVDEFQHVAYRDGNGNLVGSPVQTETTEKQAGSNTNATTEQDAKATPNEPSADATADNAN